MIDWIVVGADMAIDSTLLCRWDSHTNVGNGSLAKSNNVNITYFTIHDDTSNIDWIVGGAGMTGDATSHPFQCFVAWTPVHALYQDPSG